MRKLVIATAALLSLALMAGCSGDTASSTDTLAPVGVAKTSIEDMSDYLADICRRSEHGDYDRLEGKIDVRRGGKIRGTIETWHKDCIFEIEVPEGVMDYDPREPYVTFSMDVPRQDRLDPYRPMLFHLEPHGVDFLQPVTVTVHYPSWLPTYRDWRKYCITQEGSGDDAVYDFTDFEQFTRVPGTNEVTFKTTHFSRWVVGNSKDGPPGD